MRNNPLIILAAFLCAVLLRSASDAADTLCGGQPCEETVCSRADVILCSDWNNAAGVSGIYDGWSFSGGGPPVSNGTGLNGTAGIVHTIVTPNAGSPFADNSNGFSGVGTGPLHMRLYIRFSPGYIHAQCPGFENWSGLQKMMYLESNIGTYWRVMLGIFQLSQLPGFGSQPNTTGVFGFDYTGHFLEVPDSAGDVVVPILGDTWYAVEFMAQYISQTQNTVKVWVNGTLTMTRTNFNDTAFNGLRFSTAFDSSNFGGNPGGCGQTQTVYKDNYVVASSYIGPIGGISPLAPNNLRISQVMRRLWGSLWLAGRSWHRPAQNAANGG